LQKFANLVCLIDEVDSAIANLRQYGEDFAERMIHIGGGYFVCLYNGRECLSFTKCYYGILDGPFQATGVCVNIPFIAWLRLKEHTKAILQHRDDVVAIAPCYECINQVDPKGLLHVLQLTCNKAIFIFLNICFDMLQW
jgi:hypothetical protein